MNLRPVAYIIGFMLMAVAITMCVPAMVDGLAGNLDWRAFVVSAVVTMFVGGGLVLTCRSSDSTLSLRQAFAMTTFAWIVVTLFSALPFALSAFKLIPTSINQNPCAH